MPRKRKTTLEVKICTSCQQKINVFVYKGEEWKECQTCSNKKSKNV